MPKVVIKKTDTQYLTTEDYEALWAIRLHRCLTFDQLYKYIYCKLSKSAYCENRIRKLIDKKLLELVDYKEGQAYFLTAKGTKILQDLNGQYFIFGHMPRTLLEAPAADLKIKPSKIRHQVFLNNLALDFHQRAREIGISDYTYVDETYIKKEFMPEQRSDSNAARPDAIIKLPNNRMIFLENDMNTESKRQLQKKWDRYEVLLRYYDVFALANITVLFALSDSASVARRKNTVLSSLRLSITIPNKTFNIIVEGPKKCVDYIFDKDRNDVKRIKKKMLNYKWLNIHERAGERFGLIGQLENDNYSYIGADGYKYTDVYILKKLEIGDNLGYGLNYNNENIKLLVFTKSINQLEHDSRQYTGDCYGKYMVKY